MRVAIPTHSMRRSCRATFWFALLCLPALAATAATAADEGGAGVGGAASHTVYLVNGDSLTGEVQWLCRAGGLGMRPVHGGADMQLSAESLRAVLFHPQGRKCHASGPWLVELHNGERFPADMPVVEEGSFAVETGWAGRLAMPWEQVRALRCNGRLGGVLFSGPEASQPWLVESLRREGRLVGRGWKQHDSVIRGTGDGVAALDWDLPDVFALEFFIQWTGTPGISLALFSDALHPVDEGDPGAGLVMDMQRMEEGVLPFKSGLMMSIDGGRVGVNWHAEEGRGRFIGDGTTSVQFRDSGTAWIRVYADQIEGLVELEVDGRWIGSWRDREGGFAREGHGLTFFRTVGSRGGGFEIACVRVLEWDGEQGVRHPQKAAGDHDVIVTRQGDRIRGNLGALADQRWQMEADLGVLEVGLDDIVEVVRRGSSDAPEEEGEPSAADDMPFILTGGYRLQGGEFEVRDGVARLTHPVFGPIAFDQGILHAIVFPEL